MSENKAQNQNNEAEVKELTEKEGITIVMTTHDGRLTELADMVVDLQR